MDALKIEHRVEKAREGSYYAIAFEVPEGMESLTVSYSYPREPAQKKAFKNVIDLGLADEKGQFLGWSGSARQEVTVGEFDATPGYLMQPIRAGMWTILVGAYHVASEGVPVTYIISFCRKKPLWVFGDFHLHSDASDGQYDIAVLAARAKRLGLDFLSVTNHNNYAANLSLPAVPGLTLIPGVEWTHYKGHMNFFGVLRPFENSFIANSEKEMRRVVDEAKTLGAVISTNHPRCGRCPYLWQNTDGVSMVEIWNGPMRPANLRALTWWASLLDEGRKIAAVGGSDFHRDRSPVRLGRPVTAVYAASRGAKDILAAAAAGKSYVSASRNGVRLSLDCEGESFGGTLAGPGPHAVSFGAQKLPLGARVRLIGPGRQVLCEASRRADGTAAADTTLAGVRYAYLMAFVRLPFAGEWPLAVSSPIYFDESGKVL